MCWSGRSGRPARPSCRCTCRPGLRAHRVVRTLVDAAVRRAPSVGVLRLLVDVDPAEVGLFVTTGFRPAEGAGPARYERTLR